MNYSVLKKNIGLAIMVGCLFFSVNRVAQAYPNCTNSVSAINFGTVTLPPTITIGQALATTSFTVQATCQAQSNNRGNFIFVAAGSGGTTYVGGVNGIPEGTFSIGSGLGLLLLSNGQPVTYWDKLSSLCTDSSDIRGAGCQAITPHYAGPNGAFSYSFPLEARLIVISTSIATGPWQSNAGGSNPNILGLQGFDYDMTTFNYIYGSGMSIGSVGFGSNQLATIVNPTCTSAASPSPVVMQDAPANSISTVGATYPGANFNIQIQCSSVGNNPAVKNARITLVDSNQQTNNSNVLTLSNSSTAKNVGIQILYTGATATISGQSVTAPIFFGPLNYSTNSQVGQINLNLNSSQALLSGTTVPFHARYSAVGGAATAGTVNASAIFSIAYE